MSEEKLGTSWGEREEDEAGGEEDQDDGDVEEEEEEVNALFSKAAARNIRQPKAAEATRNEASKIYPSVRPPDRRSL